MTKKKEDGKKISSEDKKRLAIGVIVSILTILFLSFFSMFLALTLVNPEQMDEEEFIDMCYELAHYTFVVTDADAAHLSRMLGIPRAISISFDIALIEEERMIMRLKTERISVAVYIAYEDGRAVGRYGKKTFNIYYSKEDMVLIMKFIDRGEALEFAAI